MGRICRYGENSQSLCEFHIPGRHWMKWLRKLQNKLGFYETTLENEIEKYTV
jgi:hypothetical protein